MGTTAGSLVALQQCSSTTPSQVWRVGNGEIGFIMNGKLCLDGTTDTIGVQLVVNTCNTSALSQQWEIK